MYITNAIRTPLGSPPLPPPVASSAQGLGLELASNCSEPFTLCPHKNGHRWEFLVTVHVPGDLSEVPRTFNNIPVIVTVDPNSGLN